MNQVNGDDDDNGGDDYGNGFGSYDEEPLTKRVFTGQWMLPTIALEIVTDVTLSFNESSPRQLFHCLHFTITMMVFLFSP